MRMYVLVRRCTIVGADSSQTYAMKKIKKVHIVKTCQQEHIMNEKTIMIDCQSDFIAWPPVVTVFLLMFFSSFLHPRPSLISDNFTCYCEYLHNGTRDWKSEKGVANYNYSHVWWGNLEHFGSQGGEK